MLVGLTGAIGSGKSAVARLLAQRGAVVIDADAVAKEVMGPGGPAFAAVVARFGPAVVGSGGAIDRRALADVVFSDSQARAELNAIVHPEVASVVAERAAPAVAGGRVVVVEVPLLVEAGWPADVVVGVDCDDDTAVARLVSQRGMSEVDARRRLAAQATRAQRRARADIVVANDGSLDDLAAAVDRLWADLTTRTGRLASETR